MNYYLFKNLIMKLLFIFLFFSKLILAQYESHNWCFSETSRGLSFDLNTNQPAVVTNNGFLSYEGCGTATNPQTGELMFYSNGLKIVDKGHQTMVNGSGLNGGISCATNGVPCPVPRQANKYYVFSNSTEAVANGSLYYSIINKIAIIKDKIASNMLSVDISDFALGHYILQLNSATKTYDTIIIKE